MTQYNGFAQQGGAAHENKTRSSLSTFRTIISPEELTLVGSAQAGQNAKVILGRFRANSLPIFHIQHIATQL